MITAAIYARYSSDGQREASIEDQARNCEGYAKRQDWKIVARYADKAISGSVTDRPQYQQMLRDAKTKKFDILLVDDLSRLSRDQVETMQACRRLVHWGVRLIAISDGLDTSVKGYETMLGFKGVMNNTFLIDLADKTHRGLTGQALKCNHTGGRTFGYRHVPQEHPTDKDAYGRPIIIAVRRKIDPEQAKVVRQIFEWYADGHSANWIADELNRLHIPGPAASWKRKEPSLLWTVSAIRGDPKRGTGILNNQLYRGTIIWNRRQWLKDPDTGEVSARQRPEKEWIIKERPELAIISPELWATVQARQDSRQQAQVHRGRGPKFLLSGLLKCGDCGSAFIVVTETAYGCGGLKYRGASTCANHLRVTRTLVEEKILAGLKTDLFTPEAFALFKKETAKLLKERAQQEYAERNQTPKRLAKVEQEIAHISAAIKKGIVTETTKADLLAAEAERAKLTEQMKTKQTAEVTLLAALPQAEARYRKLVENIAALPAHHVDQARQQIKELIGEVKLRPTAEGYLEAEMAANYAGLLKLAVGAKISVAGGPGFEPG